MSANSLGLTSRIILGALAGLAGTMAMTSAMSRLHRRLPPKEQYPLPPREITSVLLPHLTDEAAKDTTTVLHFAYGAATGVVLAVARPQPGVLAGALYGVGIWCASYFGWVPGAGILRAANHHPPRRNSLMIGVHLIWGGVTAVSLRELNMARGTMLTPGPLLDRHADSSLVRQRPRAS